MRVIAVDPGPKHSAAVIWNGTQVEAHVIEANQQHRVLDT